jgi:hypothetical protein
MDIDDNDHNDLVEEEELPVSDGGAAKFAKVETKNGEDAYTEVVKVKGKLFRFDEGENQWKERGDGDAKILRSKENEDRHIFIMRRDGIGKIAAQHNIMKGMKLNPVQNEKSFRWMTLFDFADEEEGAPEMFIIRFKTVDDANKFRDVFNMASA